MRFFPHLFFPSQKNPPSFSSEKILPPSPESPPSAAPVPRSPQCPAVEPWGFCRASCGSVWSVLHIFGPPKKKARLVEVVFGLVHFLFGINGIWFGWMLFLVDGTCFVVVDLLLVVLSLHLKNDRFSPILQMIHAPRSQKIATPNRKDTLIGGQPFHNSPAMTFWTLKTVQTLGPNPTLLKDWLCIGIKI